MIAKLGKCSVKKIKRNKQTSAVLYIGSARLLFTPSSLNEPRIPYVFNRAVSLGVSQCRHGDMTMGLLGKKSRFTAAVKQRGTTVSVGP